MNDNDPHLTDLGHRQAAAMAARVAGRTRPPTEIIVSPAIRSQETAAPLIEATGLDPITEPDLVEMAMPAWEGEPEERVRRIFAESRDRSPEEWWDGLEGGESFGNFHIRVTAALKKLLIDRGVLPDGEGHPHLWDDVSDGPTVAIVAHAGTNSVLLTALLGVEPTPWEWERFVLAHASIARVRTIPLAGRHVFSLRAFNDQEHLARDERSA